MRITKGFVPQPVSPTMRVTRFSKIFSTILSLRAITGRDAKFDCGNGAEREELHDVGDDGDSPIFKTLARSQAQYCIAIPFSARTRREGKENGKKVVSASTTCFAREEQFFSLPPRALYWPFFRWWAMIGQSKV